MRWAFVGAQAIAASSLIVLSIASIFESGWTAAALLATAVSLAAALYRLQPVTMVRSLLIVALSVAGAAACLQILNADKPPMVSQTPSGEILVGGEIRFAGTLTLYRLIALGQSANPTICLNSHGGSAVAGHLLALAVHAQKRPTTAYAKYCASACVYPWLASDQRKAVAVEDRRGDLGPVYKYMVAVHRSSPPPRWEPIAAINRAVERLALSRLDVPHEIQSLIEETPFEDIAGLPVDLVASTHLGNTTQPISYPDYREACPSGSGT